MKRAILLLAFVLCINFVSAFGVATLYSDSYPLRMNPGESKDTFFLLRNVVEGDSDVIVKSELTNGREVAKLIDGTKDYDVSYGSEVEVPVKITVPKDAQAGSQYRVSAIFSPIAQEGGIGNIQFIVNIGKSFPVLVVEEEKAGKTVTLTVESEELVDSLAPISRTNKGILLGIIFFLIMGIVIVVVIILSYVIRSGRADNNEMPIQSTQVLNR